MNNKQQTHRSVAPFKPNPAWPAGYLEELGGDRRQGQGGRSMGTGAPILQPYAGITAATGIGTRRNHRVPKATGTGPRYPALADQPGPCGPRNLL